MSAATSSEWDGNAVHWRGLPSYQRPSDLIRYQEIIHYRRPDWVIETGGGGGTTRFLRDVCRLAGHRQKVLGIGPNSLDRIPAVTGSVMVILDSDVYSYTHMTREIEAYAPLVTREQMLVVCHTNRTDWGSHPAVTSYLSEHQEMFREEMPPPLSLCTYLERL